MSYQPLPARPPDPVREETAGLLRAGKVAVWVWVVLAVLPILVIVLCCSGFLFAGIIGNTVDPASTSAP